MRITGHLVGHGLDIVDMDDFSRLVSGPMGDHLERYFTEREIDASGTGPARVMRLAGRFAVKEAVLKALGIGWGNGVSFTDVEVVTLASGEPTVSLHREVAELAGDRGVVRWFVSVSHGRSVSVASVIATS